MLKTLNVTRLGQTVLARIVRGRFAMFIIEEMHGWDKAS
jgi:hypothetical protein